MALEFALRPRINLERLSPRPRLRRMRFAKLALPIAAYWLGIAGVTLALVRITAADSADVGADAAPRSRIAEIDEAPPEDTPSEHASSDDAPPDDAPPDDAPPGDAPPGDVPPTLAPSPPTEAQHAAAEPPLEPAFEPASMPPPPLEREPVAERRTEPSPRALAAAPIARRAPIAQPEQPPPVVRPAPRAPERRSPPIDEAVPSWTEAPKVAVAQERKAPEAPPVSLPSCESAAAAANETLDLRAAQGAPDLTREALASVLDHGAYLSSCALPARTTLEICAAVRDGKVVGVTATTEPRSPTINACVRRVVAALRFPRSARLDVTRTRFQAAR